MLDNFRRRGAIAAALLCSPAAVQAAQTEDKKKAPDDRSPSALRDQPPSYSASA